MRINELLGTAYPLIQGGMANIATGEFAAAVSNAGALGLIAGGGMPAEALRQQIRRCKALTNKPFGVNIMLMNPEAAAMAQVVIDEGVPVVTTGAGTAWSVSSSSGVASEATATMPHATAAARTAVSPRTTMFDPPVDREPTYANTVGRLMEGLGRIARPHTVDPRPQEALNLIVRSAETSTSSGSRRIEGTEPPMSMNMAAFPAPR